MIQVENWTALLILVVLCVLTLLVAISVVNSLRPQPRRAPRPVRPAARRNHFELNVPAPALEPSSPPTLWDTLTPREQQVARLSEQKMTNAQIADTLNISERTVKNHLYYVYNKLEISSRQDLDSILPQVEDLPD